MTPTDLLVAICRLAGMGWGEMAILAGLVACLALAAALALGPAGAA